MQSSSEGLVILIAKNSHLQYFYFMHISVLDFKKMSFLLAFILLSLGMPASSFADAAAGISGSVLDSQEISVGGASVKVFDTSHHLVKQVEAGAAGEFEIVPMAPGEYSVEVNAPGYQLFQQNVHVNAAASTQILAHLNANGKPTEMTVTVKAVKNKVAGHGATSSKEVNQDAIQSLPQGDDVKLPKLLATTMPGIVEGPFGQTFIRGNHANIQYQIDGVQLPDSPSSTFGQAFSPRNIDHMEVITGGVPAEYGERLSAVVNIVTKTGAEKPYSQAELGYGSYNTLTPQASFSGSNAAGNLHYYLSAAYVKTDRGLDTPEPQSSSNIDQGGKDAIHDFSNSNDEFAKLDWQLGNSDKLTFMAYNSYNFFQIPNLPSSFGPNDPIFTQNDKYGNPSLNYVPFNTDDTQAENNAYVQAVWKHSVDETSYFQLAPYYKFSKLHVTNDPTNDLYAARNNLGDSSSFSTNRSTNNYGLKGDYTNRLNDQHLLKTGFQVQTSKTTGPLSVISQKSGQAQVQSNDNSSDTGYFESVYIQDDFQASKPLSFNIGLRFDATQFRFAGLSPNDSWLQPRLGVNYLLTEKTKLHAFYGLLFQPAAVENLRDTFVNSNAGNLAPYDIKAEKDNYYEVGVAQQVADDQVINLNLYYKSAKNMLDDSQLLNTSIAQPYNFARGYAYGAELSWTGKITDAWSDYANYSYEIAKGEDISGGLFSFEPGTSPSTGGYQYLDHVQVHTANAGITYKSEHWQWAGQGLFGSGLRTDPQNNTSLPSHVSFDTSVGYNFANSSGTDSWFAKSKLSVDVLNIFDNVYPITIANGFNGSHYAAGREFFVRLVKEL
jgi:outer membrane cobalamin receptor